MRSISSLRDSVQELYELGPAAALFRAGWELRERFELPRGVSAPPVAAVSQATVPWTRNLPFADPHSVADAVRDRIPVQDLQQLISMADAAVHGRILCFGRSTADFGDPIDWHLNPRNGRRWQLKGKRRPSSAHAAETGDIKLTWEAGRFPHGYHLARAAAFSPAHGARYAEALASQMRAFIEANPYGDGVHWGSGQEVAIRLRSWLFALDVLCVRQPGSASTSELVRCALLAGAQFISEGINFARIAVNNNHLVSEALGLFSAGALLPESADARRWGHAGRQILDKEGERQFYPDGSYIQQSHNYHRVVLTDLLWACAIAKSVGDQPSASWLRAMERSLDFLSAHLNPANGRLPNYGGNDGSMPSVLSTCDFADFRPVLQTVSLAVRGERMFEPGPWDEMPAWFFGPAILDQPLRHIDRVSISFNTTGYHVLRGNDQGCFAAFRCGSLLDRFTQIDMLHLDVWWRGQNVLIDAGSYLYNGPREWHDHFMRTASHNTVTVDGFDQMLHFRQFKVLYWTKAALLEFKDTADYSLCAGEHYGYQRQPGACTHHRSVLLLKDDVWVVVDRVTGTGAHDVRLHWLGGEFPHHFEPSDGTLRLDTPAGLFTVRVSLGDGRALEGDVIAGQDEPPRGWSSRYYGEKIAVPSFAVSQKTTLPVTFVSVLSGVASVIEVNDQTWTLRTPTFTAIFDLDDGCIGQVRVDR